MKNEKRILAGLVAGMTAFVLQAQPCVPSNSQIDLEGNTIRARILNNGRLFTDLSEGLFQPDPQPAPISNPSTIFMAGLWMGGLDFAGNLKLTYVDYGSYGYSSGPLNNDGTIETNTCFNWDRHFRVRGAQVAGFLAALPDLANNPAAALAQYPGIMGWPAIGNPYFNDIWGYDLPASAQILAPFFDKNSDGSYNPLAGDYPAVLIQNTPPFVPAEMIWSVFNDVNSPQGFRMEVQQTAWAFDCPDEPALNRTVFTAHKMLYKGNEQLDSTFIGLWVDFDLGCYSDDYIGCAPGLDAFYAYNQDVVDGNPGAFCDQGITTFADHPPVQSVTLLSQSIDKFISIGNVSLGNPPAGTTDPVTKAEYYNYLTGSWRDGTPLTAGGTGYNLSGGTPVDYIFPGDPGDPNDWTMCSAGISGGDRRVLASHKTGLLQPGQIEELVVAWTVHPDPDLPCGLGTTFDDISDLKNLYEDHFAGVCSAVTGIPELLAAEVRISPNPATGAVTIDYGDLPVQAIRLFAADGRLVRILQQVPAGRTLMETGNLPAGVYTVHLLTDRGSLSRKVSVLR